MQCEVSAVQKIICNGTVFVVEEEPLSYTSKYFWIYLGVYVALVLVAGVMSGLTMGLLSLDLTSLKVLQEGGKPNERKYAARILPLVERHHLLLVTLLLANAAAVEAMPLCLDRVSDPVTAILVSVTAVLLFGEVLPQALCTRYGLAIGAFLSPLVYFLMAVTFLVAFPISKLLDCLLGEDTGTFYRRAELKALVDIHGPQSFSESKSTHNCCNEDPLTEEEVRVIKGTLEMREKKVCDAMLPLEKVFMLSVDTVLNEETMNQILTVGHSRIPVFENSAQNIVGILLVKKMVTFKPNKEVKSLRSLLVTRCIRPVLKVSETDPLFDLLQKFKTGKGHLSVVCGTRYQEEDVTDANTEWSLYQQQNDEPITGIITLEDVIEELIMDEILDEKDIPDGLARLKNVFRRPKAMSGKGLDQHRSQGWSVNSDQGLAQSATNQDPGESTYLLSGKKFQNKSLPY